VHEIFFTPPLHRAKRRGEVPARAGATPRNFWAARPQKSGVAPARFGLFCAATFAGAVVANLWLSIPWAGLRVKKVVKTKLKCVILTFFTWNRTRRHCCSAGGFRTATRFSPFCLSGWIAVHVRNRLLPCIRATKTDHATSVTRRERP